ncbi:PQQ-binding-like beta-propeller repeat protein [Myxococcus xanthus]|uniref:PQQ-binding-like beta-propeller repeat protein n=1 Tax=Myxococcus xanthus TaxID=34 RepID=A0A7Y4IJV6_MYXXA|nr:PQQ-binding-like beta-propeller repeat protein [Myxococcus xanthus]NOJ80627.1 PQQ-binding-like beta-propeller repeat protein [Myxococcus xanthus]NOJ84836.1 PQQ-binding-like beta-propeller repeat protein [Myxococcus xanthus]
MARARPTSPRCPRCHAPIVLEEGRVLYTCGYCNASIDTQGEKAPRPEYQSPAVTGTGANTAALVVGGIVSLSFMAGLVAFLSFSSATESTDGPTPTSVLGASPVVAAPSPVSERKAKFQWDSQGVPLAVDLNGDGTDDIIGRIRRLSLAPGKTETRNQVAAFDGKSFDLLWEAELEGTASDLSGAVHVVHQGGRVVMSSPDAVSILDPRTGKQLGRVALSDKPRNLCIPRGDAESVWVDVADGQNLLLNTKTAAARTVIEPPPSCAPFKWNPRMCPSQLVRRSPILCERPRNLPDVPGFSPEHVYTLNDLSVVLGERSPGSRVPMAAVFQQGQKAPLWHGNVADMDPKKVKERVVEVLAFSEDALVMAYELKEGGAQLIRRDMRTGSVSWDVPIPNSKSGSGASDIKLHGGRVYVPHWVWLDVFDAKTGNLIGTLGTW